jgi:hypothetical protein
MRKATGSSVEKYCLMHGKATAKKEAPYVPVKIRR